MNKKIVTIICSIVIVVILVIALIFTYFNMNNNESSDNTTSNSNNTTTTTLTNISSDDGEMFTTRDLEQSPDLSDAETITVKDNTDVKITEEGIYVIKGTASNVTIYIEVEKTEKVQIVLDGVNITNTSKPVVYVASADKVFVTTTDSTNTMKVTGTFNYSENESADAVIFSKDTVTLNGVGTLNIESSGNGITSKDKLKVTGGTFTIKASNHGLEANDSVLICDGTFDITSTEDGIQVENSDDQSLGNLYISGGNFTIKAGDDGIHAQTIAQITGGTFKITAAEGIEATQVVIDGGDITISASDDGINAAQKSNAYSVSITINGGTVNISMGQGDTDALDSNGDLTINGGTVNITAQFAFDFDGTGTLNGGTVTVNGSQVTTITNSMNMGGGGQRGQNPGGQNQRGGRR